MDRTKSAALDPLGRELVFTAKALREAFEGALERAGGSLGTWIVLNAAGHAGLVSQSGVASHAHVEGATITHHVDRLERLGLVRRRIDSTDRRVRRIEATPEGIRLHRRMLAAATKFEEQVFAGLDDAEREQLRQLLARVRENLAVD